MVPYEIRPPLPPWRWLSAICTMTPPFVPSSLFSLTYNYSYHWILKPTAVYTAQTKLFNKATKSFVYWTGKPQSCGPFWLPSKSHLWIKVWVWKPKASKKNVSIAVSGQGQTRKSGWRGVEKKLCLSHPHPIKFACRARLYGKICCNVLKLKTQLMVYLW